MWTEEVKYTMKRGVEIEKNEGAHNCQQVSALGPSIDPVWRGLPVTFIIAGSAANVSSVAASARARRVAVRASTAIARTGRRGTPVASGVSQVVRAAVATAPRITARTHAGGVATVATAAAVGTRLEGLKRRQLNETCSPSWLKKGHLSNQGGGHPRVNLPISNFFN